MTSSQNQRPPSPECDIVMRGGITSGVVYPGAIVEIANQYRFRSIGGTSAGAIAAAITAAASYGREHGNLDAFKTIADLPQTLGERLAGGRTRLINFFQPQPSTRRHFNLFLAMVGQQDTWSRTAMRAVLAVVSEFTLWFLAGAALAALPALLLMWSGEEAALAPAWRLVLGIVILAIVAAATGLITAAIGAVLTGIKAVGANRYGLCSGLTGASDGEPLTQWLHETIQKVAGRATDRPEEILTAGDLWDSESESDERDIDLVLITTNITHGISHRYPFLDKAGLILFARKADMEALFPAVVVQQLQLFQRTPEIKGLKLSDEFFCLPPPAKLPLVVGARMSLSFPILLSAVPLYTPDFSARKADGTFGLQKCWFSDGGITSNFPIHVFDAPIPRRPTFCLNLRPAKVVTERKMIAEMAEKDDDVRLATRNSDGKGLPAADFEADSRQPGASRPSVLGFLEAVVDTARNWGDTELMTMPGYRDRIVHVALASNEGGLNLDMPQKVIESLSRRGAKAGRKLVERFSPQADGWRNHRWTRFRSMMTAFEVTGKCFARNWTAKNATHLSETYDDLLNAKAPSCRWGSPNQEAFAENATRELVAFVNGWNGADMTFDCINRDCAPRPKVELRTMPPGGRDPLRERPPQTAASVIAT